MGLLAWGVFYIIALAPSPGAGSDFAVFYAASRATVTGANPYDWPTQWHWEDQVLNHGSTRLPTHFDFAPYANLPPFAAIIAPLSTTLPPRPAYAFWTVLGLLATVQAGIALSRWAGYAHPRVLGLLLAAAPSATFDLFLGQDSWLLLFALANAISLAGRSPVAAGMLLVLIGYPKPHLLIPIAAVFFLAYPRQRREVGLGLGLGTALWLMVTTILTGPQAPGEWWRSLALYRTGLPGTPDIASLAGLYSRWAPTGLVTVLDALLMISGAVLLLVFRPRSVEGQAGSRRFLALGVATTLTVLPFVHTHDMILLAIPLLLLIRPDGYGLNRPVILLAVAVTFLAPLATWTDYHRPFVDTLSAACTMVACLVVYKRGAAVDEQQPMITAHATA